jgi:ribulose-phosphate 3-epimerase
MMVSKPQQWIADMADAGVDQYTFHVEPVMDEIPLVCRKIREAGMKVGLALKPGTDVSVIAEYVEMADMILVMTVEPGFGGQKFMSDMMTKVEWLRQNYPDLDIEVDGGVGPSTIDLCAKVGFFFNLFELIDNSRVRSFSQAGANMIVSGTAVIKADNQKDVILSMRNAVNNAIKGI